MRKLRSRVLVFTMIAAMLMQSTVRVNTAEAKVTAKAGAQEAVLASFSDTLNEKSEEFVKKLARTGIKKAIGKIPVVGGLVESIAGPYIDKLLGIKAGESTNDKLDKMNEKLDTLLQTVTNNTNVELEKIYELKFSEFHTKLTTVKNSTAFYLKNIAAYEKMTEKEAERTVLIGSLTNQGDFNQYIADIMLLSQYITGEIPDLHNEGDIYTKAYKVFCNEALQEDGVALGGEAAMLASDYVNAINEIIDSAHTTATMIILARSCVDNHIEDYKGWQTEGMISPDISLNGFSSWDAVSQDTNFNLLKGMYYKIFGVTEEDVKEYANLGIEKKVAPGVIDNYNQMIEDRWFDYITGVDFTGSIPKVSFIEMDGAIGFASIESYGFEASRAMSISEDDSVGYLKGISGRALANKRSALSDAQFDALLKHISTSPNFKLDKAFEGADYADITLRDALIHYGFSFDAFDRSMMNSDDYTKIFMTDAKYTEKYYNSYEPATHEGHINGYVYGIDYNLNTKEIGKSQARKEYQYFKGDFSDQVADKRSVDFPKVAMLYFNSTVVINSTGEFVEFIDRIAEGTTYAGKCIYLNCDVNLGGTRYLEHWPNSARANEFRGTFDGGGHTIRNLTISSGENRLALFRTTGEDAVIKNLRLDNINIENTANQAGYAALVGYANGNLTLDNIQLCSGSIKGYRYVGGLVGETKEGKYVTVTLKSCTNFASVTSVDNDAAGIIANCAALDIFNCENRGNITAEKGAAGGIVAYMGNKDTDPRAIIECCTNYGNITGYDCAGGICGNMESDNSGVVVAENKNEGNITVTAKRSAGGIVGRTCSGGAFADNRNSGIIVNQSTNDDAEAGGILGENEDDEISVTGNENYGGVTAYQRAGGIVGTLGDRDHDKVCTVSRNRNSGKIISTNKDAGGIVGGLATDNTKHSIVSNVNSGAIEGKSEAGGIIGWMAGGGLFDGNVNKAKVTSLELNAGGIVGRIQDDACDFKRSDVGNPYAGVGSISPRATADRDYVINAKNTKQHAGKICGWDGKKKQTINSDNLAASIFGNGSVVMILIMCLVLVAAAAVSIFAYGRRKKKAESPEAPAVSEEPEEKAQKETDELKEEKQ